MRFEVFEMERVSFALLLIALAIAALAQGNVAPPPVPAHHAAPPKRGEKLPPILPRDQLSGPAFQNAYQVHAYELASQIPQVIYQMPCYCYCDRSEGHTSLHSCYESGHAAHCGACMKELYYTYSMHKQRKTVAQIRQRIIKGDWKDIDLVSSATMK